MKVGDLRRGIMWLVTPRDHIKMRHYMDRRVTPLKRVTSHIWGPPTPGKQALSIEKYLSQAKLTLPRTSSQGGDDYLFGNIQTKYSPQSICPGSKLSYSRCKEVLLKKIADVGLDPKSFSWHSFRSGQVHLPPLMVVSPIERLGAIVDGVRKTLRMATLKTR